MIVTDDNSEGLRRHECIIRDHHHNREAIDSGRIAAADRGGTTGERGGGGGGGQSQMYRPMIFFLLVSPRGQSCTLLMIPLPHYEHFATTFCFQVGKKMLDSESPR